MNVNDWLAHLVDELNKTQPRAESPHKKIAIISTPRSGSGYFCEKLTNTGVFGNLDEWFHPDIFKIFAKQENSQRVRFTSYLNFIVSRTMSDNMVFSVNFHINQYMDWQSQGIDLLKIGFDKVFYVYRKDKIAQAYSLAKARKTGQWNSEMTPTRAIKSSEITNSMILNCLHSISLWDEFFESNIKNQIHSAYEYEEFINDDSIFQSILDQCDIKSTNFKNSEPKIKMQRNEEDFARLESFKQYLNLKDQEIS